MWRQGDVFISVAREIPESAKSRAVPHGTLVHGEVTGHSHRIEDLATARLFSGDTFGEIFLDVVAPLARIIHEEHGTIELPKGTYRVWRQREYSPEAIRYVID